MYHQTNKINSEKEIEVRNEEVCNKPIELPKPKLERQIAFNIKDLPATKLWSDIEPNSKLWSDIEPNSKLWSDIEPNSKLWSDIVFNPQPNIDFDTESDDEEEKKWDCIDLLNRILCNSKLISYKR